MRSREALRTKSKGGTEEGSWRKLRTLFIFYAISRNTSTGVDELLRERIPLPPSRLPGMHTLPGAGKRAVRDPAAIQRKDQSDLLERHRPLADGQDLPA